MSTMQIRNVPEDVARRTKARATLRGMSLSDYLLELVSEQARRPTIDEVRERLRATAALPHDVGAAELVRRLRESS